VSVSSTLSKPHLRRLREIFRSAGWPCLDNIEIDLLAHGLIARRRPDAQGVETLRVTDDGIAILSQLHARNRGAMSKHEALVDRIASTLQRDGRVVWTGLTTRAAAGHEEGKTHWRMAVPDVFSIRNSSVETMLEPIVHEIKVHRADLLSDLRNAPKRDSYLALSSQAFYVLAAGVGAADEIPEPFGVLVADGQEVRCERFAQKRECKLAFSVWMSLAKSTPLAFADNPSQAVF
jgi:hypothetical protein